MIRSQLIECSVEQLRVYAATSVTGTRSFHGFTVEYVFRGLVYYLSHYESSLYTHIGHRWFH